MSASKSFLTTAIASDRVAVSSGLTTVAAASGAAEFWRDARDASTLAKDSEAIVEPRLTCASVVHSPTNE